MSPKTLYDILLTNVRIMEKLRDRILDLDRRLLELEDAHRDGPRGAIR